MTQNIVISTGAGISAESGIKTFRDSDGLWTKFNPDAVASIDGWNNDPQQVIDFHNLLRQELVANDFQPNAAHHALTKLQREWKHGRATIVSQNIDGLHQTAGSTGVVDIHGNLRQKYCMSCGYVSDYDADIVLRDACQKCGGTSSTRPKIVMFGEYPHYLPEVEVALSECSIFVAIGSSLEVAPANSFGNKAKGYGAETYLLNLDPPTRGDLWHWDHHIYGLASVIVPEWVDRLLAENP